MRLTRISSRIINGIVVLRFLRKPEILFFMLTRRIAYLGLLACLVTATALGVQPGRTGSLFVEQESESDAPAEESSEKEIESECGFPVRRRNAALVLAIKALPVEVDQPPRSVKVPPSFSCPGAPQSARNGFGGPLRL